MKSLGESNDSIPADEMFVAKIIQNAKGRGLGWTSGAYYANEYGAKLVEYTPNVVACCAVGSFLLEDDTRYECVRNRWSIIAGNDCDQLVRDSNVIGRAYRDAMGANDGEGEKS